MRSAGFVVPFAVYVDTYTTTNVCFICTNSFRDGGLKFFVKEAISLGYISGFPIGARPSDN